MSQQIHLLIVEDSPADAELMVEALRETGFRPEWRRVETAADYLAELQNSPDVILADYNLPQFNAPHALELLKRSGLDIPLIVTTGSISEAAAVDCMKQGAADYILKDRIARLPGAIERALEEKRLRDEKRRTDAILQAIEARKGAILESALDCIITMDHHGKILEFNPAAERTFGYSQDEVIGKEMAELIIPPSLREKHRRGLTHYLTTGKGPVLGERIEITGMRKDATEFPVELSIIRISGSEPPIFTGFVRDITERKAREREIQQNSERIRALHEIDLAIRSTLDLRTVSSVLLEKVDIFFSYPTAATIRLVNKITGALQPLACRNLNEFVWKTEPGSVLTNMVAETRASLTVEDIQTDPRTEGREFFRRYNLVSYLGVPLISKRELLGVLSIYSREKHEFTTSEIEFLKTLGGQAAIAISNSQLYEESKDRAAELEKANKVKDEFLSVMSHELRTPLSVVMGYVGMIKDGMMGEVNKQQAEALQKVLSRTTNQLDMINEIMQTTQLEAHAMNVNRESLDLRDLIDQLKSDYKFRADKKDVTLSWDYPAASTPISTDSVKLKQVMHNLINNAIKFTDKGTVTVSAHVAEVSGRDESGDATPSSRASKWLEFKVADTGIGISKDMHQAIFNKFHQVDSSETRLYGGVGLGLYIVKSFVDLLGGTVELESELGQGSTFTVTIPVTN